MVFPAACTTMPRPQPQRPFVWWCERSAGDAQDRIRVERTLDQSGNLKSVYAYWHFSNSALRGTSWDVFWMNPAELDLSKGWLQLEFDTFSSAAKNALGREKYWVELSTSPETITEFRRGWKKTRRTWRSLSPDLATNWSGVMAMVRNAEHLYVLARNEGRVLRSVEIDRQLLLDAETRVVELAGLTRKDAQDPAAKCVRAAIEDSSDIVIS